MTTRTTMRASMAGSMVALAAITLTGCGADPVEDAVQGAAENAVEKAVENGATDGSGGDVDLDIGDDVAVPDSFPSELPLPDGKLLSAVTIDEGTQLNYEIDDPAVAEDLAAQLASNAEFEEQLNSNVGGIHTWTYTSDKYSVTIGLIPDDPTSQMSYLVVTNAA